MKLYQIFTLIGLSLTFFLGCTSDVPTSVSQEAPIATLVSHKFEAEPLHPIPYQLNRPNETFLMIDELNEISGLTIAKDGQSLWAVQDEKGKLYQLDIKNGEVLRDIKFHKAGDYEGIEVVGDDVFVVKSTGTIYQVKNAGTNEQTMTKFNGFLSRENDVEGLGYDAANGRLLLACKGVPATGESFEEIRYKKVIYSFDLKNSNLNDQPTYSIQLERICKYLDQNKTLKQYEKLKTFFNAGKENLTFNPSAIAVHPHSKHIYILSSVGKVLIMLDSKGKIIGIEKMDKSIHRQPEGIAFAADGTLYIANEGKGGKARIHRFVMQ